MLDLNRFFFNPFNDPDISDSELRAFTEDHLGRLSAANDAGAHTARLTATTAAFTGFDGEVSDQSLNRALLKAATSAMASARDAFVGWITVEGEAQVIVKARKGTPLYIKFFPSGLTEYHNATLQTLPALLDRAVSLVTGANAGNGTLLGTEFVAKVQALETAFTQARGAQVGLKGDKTDNSTDRRAAKMTLADQLFANLLNLALLHRDQPDMVASYMNQSLLEDAAQPIIGSGSDMFTLSEKKTKKKR